MDKRPLASFSLEEKPRAHFPSMMSKIVENKKALSSNSEDSERTYENRKDEDKENSGVKRRPTEAKAVEASREMMQVLTDQMLKFIIWKCDYTLKSLTSLPDNVIGEIISKCDPRSRNRLRLTCKKIKEIEGKTTGSYLRPVLAAYVHWSPIKGQFTVGVSPLGKFPGPKRRIECNGLNSIETSRVLFRMCNLVCTIRVYVKINLGDNRHLNLLKNLPFRQDLHDSKLLKIKNTWGKGRASPLAAEKIAEAAMKNEVATIWLVHLSLPNGCYAELYKRLKLSGDQYELVMLKEDKFKFVDEVFGLGKDYCQKENKYVTTTKNGEIYFCGLTPEKLLEDATFSCGVKTVVIFDEGWMTTAEWNLSARDGVKMERKGRDEVMWNMPLTRIPFAPASK